MATTKNITMKQFNGTDYDTLYPKTKVEQVENLTPFSIGAVNKSGDTMTGDLWLLANENGAVRVSGWDDSNGGKFMTIEASKTGGSKGRLIFNSSSNDMDLIFQKYEEDTFYNTWNVLHTGNAQSLGFLKIAIGSYTGTGTYGADSPNTLNLGVVPKLVLIMSTTETKFTTGAEGGYANYGIFDPNITQMGAVRGSIHVSFSGTTLSWYADVNSNYYPETQQLNKSGVVYNWYVLY